MGSQDRQEALTDLWGVSNQTGQLGLGLQKQLAYLSQAELRGGKLDDDITGDRKSRDPRTLYKVCEASSIMPGSFPGLGVHEGRESKVRFHGLMFQRKRPEKPVECPPPPPTHKV